MDSNPKPVTPRFTLELRNGYASILAGVAPTCIVDVDLNSDPPVGVRVNFDEETEFLRRVVAALNACRDMPTETLNVAGTAGAPGVREWFDTWGEAHKYAPDGDVKVLRDDYDRLVAENMRLRATPAAGFVIEHANGGRWRTLDTIGMPDWTDNVEKALMFSLREHADAFSCDDPEDVRIKQVSGPRPPVAFGQDAGTRPLRYDGLYDFANKYRINYNELCRAVREAIGGAS